MSFGTRREAMLLGGMIGFKRYFCLPRCAGVANDVTSQQSIFHTSHTTNFHRGHQVEIWNAALWPIYELLGMTSWRGPISLPNVNCSMTPPPSKPIYVVE